MLFEFLKKFISNFGVRAQIFQSFNEILRQACRSSFYVSRWNFWVVTQVSTNLVIIINFCRLCVKKLAISIKKWHAFKKSTCPEPTSHEEIHLLNPSFLCFWFLSKNRTLEKIRMFVKTLLYTSRRIFWGKNILFKLFTVFDLVSCAEK